MPRVIPPTTRSLLVLAMGAELTLGAASSPVRQATATVDLGGGHTIALFGSSTIAGIEAVAEREVALAIVNPSATLTLAHRGTGPFEIPLPLRTIAVIPSRDQYVFAVHPKTGLRSFDEIAAKRPALRIGVRGDRAHSLHFMLDDIMHASGFTRDDIRAWGGEFRFEGVAPTTTAPKFGAFLAGDLDAIWDEGADSWIGEALDAGMTVLSLGRSGDREARGARLPARRDPAITLPAITARRDDDRFQRLAAIRARRALRRRRRADLRRARGMRGTRPLARRRTVDARAHVPQCRRCTLRRAAAPGRRTQLARARRTRLAGIFSQ